MTKSNEKNERAYGKWKSATSLAFGQKSGKERLIYPATAAFFFVMTFIFCSSTLPYTELSLGIPLADALLCAGSVYTPFVYAANLIGTIYFGHARIERFLYLTFIFVLRIISSGRSIGNGESEHVFSEKPITKIAVSAVMAFIECGMFVAVSGISAQSARSVLATLITLPTLSLIFSVYYAKPQNGIFLRFLYEISMLFIFSSLVYCSKNLDFAFFEADVLFAVFFTLCIAKYGGFARASIFGFVMGYISSPSYFFCYVLLGACASLTFSFGVFSSCGISAAVAGVCAIIVNGYTSLLSFVPDTVLACAVSSPILRYSFLPKGFPYPGSDFLYQESSDAHRIAYAELSSCKELHGMSENLKALSDSITELTSQPVQNPLLNDEIMKKITKDFCDKCPLSPICLDTELNNTKSALRELIALSSGKGDFPTESIPKYLSSHCIRLRELTELVKELTQSLSLRASSKQDNLLLSYSCAADMLSSIAASTEKELVTDAASERKVRSSLHELGISFTQVAVIGNERKRIYIYGLKKSKVEKVLPELMKSLEKIFGYGFSVPTVDDTNLKPTVFTPATVLSADIAVSSSCKKGEAVSGDTAISFTDEKGNLFALISDGMGSGYEALKSSSITASLLKNLLLSGVDENLAVKMTGDALGKLCGECFSTVDLVRLNLINGRTEVTKSYAPASYVIRNGSVYCCDSSSLPIGINTDSSPFETDFLLGAGDTVIMVSDGIAEKPDDQTKLTDLLGLLCDVTPKELADRIVAHALQVRGRSDDMSAIVIRLKKAV